MKMNVHKLLKGTLGAAAGLAMGMTGIAQAQDAPQPPRIEQAERTDRDVNQDVGRRPDGDAFGDVDRGPRQGRVIERGADGARIDSNRPVLGIRIRNMDNGVAITTVRPNSPAKQAGLQVGDHIISVNGHQVNRTDDVISRLRDAQQDADIKLVVERNGEKQDISSQITTYGEAFGRGVATNERGNLQRREVLRPNLEEQERNATDAPPAESVEESADDADLPEVPSDAAEDKPEAAKDKSKKEKNSKNKKDKSNNKKDKSNNKDKAKDAKNKKQSGDADDES